MDEFSITPVTQGNVASLDQALRQLAADLGDDYRADGAKLAAAVCGPGASCLAVLAMRDGGPMGAVLAAPVFSTTRGGAGLFVSDLWVAQGTRGKGLARRLLARILQEGARRNIGGFLKLTVYHDNHAARAAYARLGFSASVGEANMVLTGAALETLRETT